MKLKPLKDVYKEKVIPEFGKVFGTANVNAIPRIEKVIVNVGTGRVQDQKDRDDLKKYLELITGQRPQDCQARIAISSFKTRKGSLVGMRVTLRGRRMYDFLDRFVYSAIPRMRDFRGLKSSAIDEHGNLNIGIQEHIIFPEIIGEDVRRVFSLQVIIVTNAKNREKARFLFQTLGFPVAR